MIERSLSDILLALGRAATDAAGWAAFLDQIARQLGAPDARLYLRDRDRTRGLKPGEGFSTEPLPTLLTGLRYGRVYTTDELADYALLRPPGPFAPKPGTRVMGVRFSGGEVWLHLLHASKEFRAQDTALLSSLQPHLALAGETFLRHEASARDAARSGALVRQLSTGWILLDMRGQVLAADSAARGLIEAHLDAGSRSPLLATDKADALVQCIARVLSPAAIPVRERLVLREGPRLELLLTRDAAAPNAAFCYLRLCDPPLPDATALAEMLGITPAEARLALALAAGTSIAGAAAQLGLTTETARNYSKKIYAKTGLDGQSALIRHLWSGVALMRG